MPLCIWIDVGLFCYLLWFPAQEIHSAVAEVVHVYSSAFIGRKRGKPRPTYGEDPRLPFGMNCWALHPTAILGYG